LAPLFEIVCSGPWNS